MEILLRKRAEARKQKRALLKADNPESYCTVSGCLRRPSRRPLPWGKGLCYSCAKDRFPRDCDDEVNIIVSIEGDKE